MVNASEACQCKCQGSPPCGHVSCFWKTQACINILCAGAVTASAAATKVEEALSKLHPVAPRANGALVAHKYG